MENIGGQAVMEGIMFRSPDKVVVSVRKKDNVKVKKLNVKLFAKKFRKLFFLRGIINLIEALYVGVKAINYSASEASESDEKESVFVFVLTFLLAFLIALFIFKFIPYFVAGFFAEGGFVFGIVEGIVKLGIFILYIYLISFMKDIRRMFEYHGAEHKVVNCFEAGEEVNMENVKKYGVIHKRCGTSFLFFVVFISVVFYVFIPVSWGFWEKFIVRILLLPVIAGVSYEVLKLSDKYNLKFLSWPGLWIQKLTTREPDEKQLEVGVKGLKFLLKG